MKKATIVFVAAICLLLVSSEAAVAKQAKTSVELEEVTVDPKTGEGTYEGKVRSKRSRCEKRRKVTLIHNSNPPFTIGETTTDEDGNWTINGPVPPVGDSITVKVKKTSKCRGTSKTYELEES